MPEVWACLTAAAIHQPCSKLMQNTIGCIGLQTYTRCTASLPDISSGSAARRMGVLAMTSAGASVCPKTCWTSGVLVYLQAHQRVASSQYDCTSRNQCPGALRNKGLLTVHMPLYSDLMCSCSLQNPDILWGQSAAEDRDRSGVC